MEAVTSLGRVAASVVGNDVGVKSTMLDKTVAAIVASDCDVSINTDSETTGTDVADSPAVLAARLTGVVIP